MSTPASDVRRLVPAALVAMLTLVGTTSCSGDDEPKPSGTPSPSATPLSAIDTTALVVRREEICPKLGTEAVEAALGSSDHSNTSYENGDTAQLTPEVKDVAHEYGCTWESADGRVARAWVFAPPTTPQQARQLRRDALRPGCAAARRVDFGSISVTTRCGTRKTVEEGYYGLFGDAWLSCTLADPKPESEDLTERADDWCGAVALAAAS
ncbi:hypothetical protein ACT8ZV_12725 [Nocardioides sp. MAHUQ-72]|uniref:hypothetical protein n=1 Tax=unclassified Nocardioides TaxID=2615069 RepID=UPI003609CA74